VTDYDTNYAFVRHVLSMDTTFPGNALLYRRVTSPAPWQAGYALILAGEGLTGIALAVATISLVRHLRSDGVRFNRAKRFTIIGAAVGFLVVGGRGMKGGWPNPQEGTHPRNLRRVPIGENFGGGKKASTLGLTRGVLQTGRRIHQSGVGVNMIAS
jgi:hypothetical protein